MKIELVALKGLVYAKPFQLGDGQKLVLGRGADADIQILDLGLSRHHCALEKLGDEYSITDLGSTNGTWVNGKRVEFQRLTPGDHIRIGAVEFELRRIPDRRRMEADLIASIPHPSGHEIKENLQVEGSNLMELSQKSESIENYRRIQRDLATIYRVGNLISGESDLASLYDRILAAILQVVRADRGFLVIANAAGQLEPVAHRQIPARPDPSRASGSSDAADGSGFSSTVVEECYKDRTSILRSNALLDPRYSQAESVVAQDIHSVLCVPVETPDRVIGVIYVDTVAQSEAFLQRDLELLLAVGRQAGLAIQRVQLSERLRQMLRGTVRALAAAIEAKDDYTKGHSERVTSYALRIGGTMQLDEGKLRTLELAGFLHDVGKIGVPENILRKAGPLTEEEYRIVKEHSRIGSSIVRNIEGAEEISEAVLHHHERWDGNGYPDGLAQEKPSFLARILAVADAFDSMCSERPYRDRLALEKVLRTIQEAAGTQFDPRAAEALLNAVSEGKILPAGARRPAFLPTPRTGKQRPA